jgi:hypothetical protein
MSILIQNLRIQNFKSVKDLSLECDRINIFIGKPNAGKSNILEAISLLGFPYPYNREGPYNILKKLMRFNTMSHLFYRFDLKKPIKISVNGSDILYLKEVEKQNHQFEFRLEGLVSNQENRLDLPNFSAGFLADGSVEEAQGQDANRVSSVKKYAFAMLIESKVNGSRLTQPNGDNFYSVVESHPELQAEIQQFLKPNGLELLLDIDSKRMLVVQKSANTLLSFPLHLVPDTFQRYIFHLAAIMSNRDSVLLFEEPESHSYAPYVYQLAQHILDDEGGNQFFITTHSPYFLLPLLQEAKDVAVFATWFEDYQTHARRLSETELRDIRDYGVDLFLNIDHFAHA